MIVQKHIDFMRSVVQLARLNGVNHLNVEFDLASSQHFMENTYNRTRVKANWCEGRHGTVGSIQFSSEDSVTVSEQDKP